MGPVAGDYDFIVIDTPPSLGVLTVNAFTCATDILIPTTAGIFATAGISQLNETVTSVQKYCNPAVKVRGILFTRFNPRANISRQMKELAEQLGEYISAPIYKTYIRSAVVASLLLIHHFRTSSLGNTSRNALKTVLNNAMLYGTDLPKLGR